MDIRTGLSIYNKQWLIEPNAGVMLLDFWDQVKAGKADWDYNKAKGSEGVGVENHSFGASVVFAPANTWEMQDFAGFAGATVAVIPVVGPIMKNDFCGALGTSSLTRLTQMASSTPSVKAILFLHDSPGGTVDGTQTFANAIKESPKLTISAISGYMCSADYWIGSSADRVYATSETDIIGSIGTMVSLYDNTEAMKQKGVVIKEYYATESKDKNRTYKEATQGNGKALVEEMLDPLNDVFLQTVKINRAGKINSKNENVLTGKTYISGKALAAGLIDGIKSIDAIMAEALAEPSGVASKIEKNNNHKIMTAQEFKAAHPAAYAEIVKEGQDKERERVSALMVYNDVDPKAVAEAIEKGGDLTPKMTAEFGRKLFAKTQLTAIEGEAAPAVATAELGNDGAVTAEAAALAKFNEEVKQHLKKY